MARCERQDGWVVAGLFALCAAVYGRTAGFAFVNFDDQLYVTGNAQVLQGLSWEGLRWAFTTFDAFNWQPLTWLSLQLDATLFGPHPGALHLVSAALHAANAALVFRLLADLTGERWRSALGAALFAAHPLRVESVAWVSERKDVLCALFFLLALRAWLAYGRSPSARRYAAAAALVALALLAKPMAVTLPVLFLLLDAWPLARLRADPRRALLEKLPLLALCAAAGLVTLAAQERGGVESAFAALPLADRLANAPVSAALYLRQLAWPTGLAAFYPLPPAGGGPRPSEVLAAAALLLALGALAWRERARRPWLWSGLAFYLVTLAPVVGLVQVGGQAHADRYTYLPSVGISLVLAWAWGDLAGIAASPGAAPAGGARRRWLTAAAAAWVGALAAAASVQAGYWRDSASLHRRSLAVTEGNFKAWAGLGDALLGQGQPAEALEACGEALRLRPDLAEAWQCRGTALGTQGRHGEAAASFREAVRLAPRFADAWYNLGTAYGALGHHADAAACFEEATRLAPAQARAWLNLSVALALAGRRHDAARTCRALAARRPGLGASCRSAAGLAGEE